MRGARSTASSDRRVARGAARAHARDPDLRRRSSRPPPPCSRRSSRADLGIAPKWIGVFVGLVYVGAMFASLASGGVHRSATARSAYRRPACCCASSGIALMAYSRRTAAVVAARRRCARDRHRLRSDHAGVVAGAGAHRAAVRMALTFSIKQTGVPAGAALAGAMLPGAGAGAGLARRVRRRRARGPGRRRSRRSRCARRSTCASPAAAGVLARARILRRSRWSCARRARCPSCR